MSRLVIVSVCVCLLVLDVQSDSNTNQIEREKQKILTALKLKAPPNITESLNLPNPLLRPRNDANTIYVFLLALTEAKNDDNTINDISNEDISTMPHILKFRVAETTYTKEDITNSFLWIFVEKENEARTAKFAVESLDNGQKVTIPAQKLKNGWVNVTITDIVRDWPRDEEIKINQLKLSCENCISVALLTDTAHRPFLEIQLAASRRKRETTPLCDPNYYSNCCLKKQLIHFREIGWNNWIFSPTRYWANYCTGNCRNAVQRPYSSLLAAKGVKVNRCCVPKKTTPLQIVYLKEDMTVDDLIVNDMSVDSCECSF